MSSNTDETPLPGGTTSCIVNIEQGVNEIYVRKHILITNGTRVKIAGPVGRARISGCVLRKSTQSS